MSRTLYSTVIAAAALLACSPSEQQKAQRAEERRIACLDKRCEGDVVPPRDYLKEEALKLNGQWFIGPSEYFSTGINGASFEWWDHRPLRPSEPRPAGAQAIAVAGNGYDIAIEVFMRAHDGVMHGPSQYQYLQAAQDQGRLLERSQLRPGLELWRVRDDTSGLPTTAWYVASNLRDGDGEPPVLGCDDRDPKFDRCSMAFTWRPGIAVRLRFRGRHGADWPEIYQEVTRVLSLLRKP